MEPTEPMEPWPIANTPCKRHHMRRTRSDSKLASLTEDQKRQLYQWLLTSGLSLEEIRKLVTEHFHLSTSLAPLSQFFHAYCPPEILRRGTRVSAKSDIKENVKRTPGKWDPEAIDALKQKIFELATCPRGYKASDITHLFSLFLKSREQDLLERKVRALEAASGIRPGTRRTRKALSVRPLSDRPI